MNITNLYSLSKDELIYLISTIQQPLQEELKNNEAIFSAIRDKCHLTSIDRCSYKGCHRFFLFEENLTRFHHHDVDYYNDGRITFCDCLAEWCDCSKLADLGIGWWCKEHLPKDCLINPHINRFNFTCGKCVKLCSSNYLEHSFIISNNYFGLSIKLCNDILKFINF